MDDKQEVCPIGMIGYDIPAEVYIGEDGLLYCRYDFKEENDMFESPAQTLDYYLKNNVPIGVDKNPIIKIYRSTSVQSFKSGAGFYYKLSETVPLDLKPRVSV